MNSNNETNNSTYHPTGKNLIVTEKPSVAQQYAHALGIHGRKDGYIEGGDWIITWCVGHLVTLSYPERYDPELKKWTLETLPFLPETYKYEVLERTKKQYNVVKDLLNRKDVTKVWNAGDSAREGEYIQRLVYKQAGAYGKKPFMRIWIDSQTDDEIRKGIKNAKPESAYDTLSDAAYMRAIEDYAVGINLTRALTKKFGYAFNKKLGTLDKKIVIAVGRVMTCVLGMIVERELEIRDFKPVDYFKIDALGENLKAHWKAVRGTPLFESDLLYNESGFKDKKDAEALMARLNKDLRLTVEKIEEKDEKKNAPLLYNLAELQSECSKIYKISPDETLEIAQALYDAKLTTYPRTDARVLSSAVCKEIDTNLCGLKDVSEVSTVVDGIMKSGAHKNISNTRYCDDQKISDHYAIIPTGLTDTDGLSDLERKVYMLIVKRFLAIFLPAAVYKKTNAIFSHSSGEKFFAGSKQLKEPGYLALYGGKTPGQEEDSEESSGLSLLREKQVIDVSFDLITSTTQPPKRFTSGSMILAMENAGNLIEDEELRAQIKGSGIGTSATRAETIKKLVANRYISLEKKTQILKPTDVGFAVYDIVKDTVPALLNPKMTASWEKGLTAIEKGQLGQVEYRAKLEDFVRKAVEEIKAKTSEAAPQVKKEVVGDCPICGNPLYETEKSYFCSKWSKNNKNACKFAFSKRYGQTLLPLSAIAKLLRGEPTELLKLTSKEGKEYEASIIVSDTGECRLEFPHEETGLKCPGCGKPMIKGTYSYECEACKKRFYHTISGKAITEEEMQTLFDEMVAGPWSGFKTKEGVPYSAYLALSGNDIITMNTKLAGRDMSKDDLIKLIEDGHTEELSGFISKAGKEFSAKLKLKAGRIEFDFEDTPKKAYKKTGKKKRK